MRLNTEVKRIEQRPGGWRLRTPTSDIDARHVVVATGLLHSPWVPDFVGLGDFAREVLHSSAYRNPTPYAGRTVLVVGSGSSGMEIARDVATGGAAEVWLAVRTPPNIVLRQGPAGLPDDVIATPLYHAPARFADAITRRARRATIGDLTAYGLPIPDEGPFMRLARLGVSPSLVDMEVIDAIRDGSIEIVRTVDRFDRDGVTLVDGRRLEPDVVIAATGYRCALEPLVGHLGVLDGGGAPRAQGYRPAAEGLWFIGFMARPSLIAFVAKQSRRLAKQIA